MLLSVARGHSPLGSATSNRSNAEDANRVGVPQQSRCSLAAIALKSCRCRLGPVLRSRGTVSVVVFSCYLRRVRAVLRSRRTKARVAWLPAALASHGCPCRLASPQHSRDSPTAVALHTGSTRFYPLHASRCTPAVLAWRRGGDQLQRCRGTDRKSVV